MIENIHRFDRPVPHITLMGATNRALTFRHKLKMKYCPMRPAGVQQPGGASFNSRCSAIAEELKTVRE
jgi:hypothetical protein